MRMRVLMILAFLAFGAGTVSPVATSVARARTSPEGGLVPASACGDAWLDWRAGRFSWLQSELAAIQARGGDQSAALGGALRAYVSELRTSDPPAALAGVMVMDAWLAEEAAAAWELYEIGGSTGFNRDQEARFHDYRARVFAAFAAICPTRHAFETWTFSDGTVAQASPVAERTEPAARAEVCAYGWVTAKRAQALRIVLEFPEWSFYNGWRNGEHDGIADRERSSRPPVAGVAVSIVFTYLFDELTEYARWADLWNDPEQPMPGLLRYDGGPFAQDVTYLLAAYDEMCGTTLLPAGSAAEDLAGSSGAAA
jgi:hypothetical protein